jgi:hypothetical protein
VEFHQYGNPRRPHAKFLPAIKPHKLHHCYSQASQALAVQAYILGAGSTCFIGTIINKETSNTVQYCQLIKIPKYWDIWTRSFANELGRLFQGICKHKVTDICLFIKKSDGTKRGKYRYGRIVCNYCPWKDEPHRTWLTVGGDCIDYPWDKSMPTANLTITKLLFNSTISTPGAFFYGIDLANFYLNTPMECYKYMRFWADILPKKLLTNTGSPTLLTPVDGYMSKSERACTLYPRTASLQISSLNNALPSEATINASTRLVCGITCGVTSPSSLLSMTLASKQPVWSTQNISSHPSKNTTLLQSIGQGSSSVESN